MPDGNDDAEAAPVAVGEELVAFSSTKFPGTRVPVVGPGLDQVDEDGKGGVSVEDGAT